jgi:HdeA/HdeB family protein
MTNSAWAIATVALVSWTSSAAAETKVDMATVSCGDLSSMQLEEFVVIGAWMSGYHNGKRGNTAIDIKELAGNSAKVAAFCQGNPTVTVMKAVETLSASSK